MVGWCAGRSLKIGHERLCLDGNRQETLERIHIGGQNSLWAVVLEKKKNEIWYINIDEGLMGLLVNTYKQRPIQRKMELFKRVAAPNNHCNIWQNWQMPVSYTHLAIYRTPFLIPGPLNCMVCCNNSIWNYQDIFHIKCGWYYATNPVPHLSIVALKYNQN